MAIQFIQKLIYKNLVKKPAINRALDNFGKDLNKRKGLPFATGLTRNKAILFASNDPEEIRLARKFLFATKRTRALKAIEAHGKGKFSTKTLKATARQFWPRGKYIPYEPIAIALEANLSPDEIVPLFKKFELFKNPKSTNIYPKHGKEQALIFTKAIEKAAEFLSTQHIIQLFDSMGDHQKFYPDHFLQNLPAALKDISSTLSEEQSFDLLQKISQYSTGTSLIHLPAAIKSAEKHSSPKKITALFSKTIEKERINASLAFQVFPQIIETGIDYLLPEELFDLIEKFADGYQSSKIDFKDKTKSPHHESFGSAWESLPHILARKIPPAEILDFFNKIMQEFQSCSEDIFISLPAMLQSDYSLEQIIAYYDNLLSKLDDKPRVNSHLRLVTGVKSRGKDQQTLSTISIKKLNEVFAPDKASRILILTNKECGDQADQTHQALPPALEIASKIFPADELYSLIFYMISSCKAWSEYALSAFPAFLKEAKPVMNPDLTLKVCNMLIGACGHMLGEAFESFGKALRSRKVIILEPSEIGSLDKVSGKTFEEILMELDNSDTRNNEELDQILNELCNECFNLAQKLFLQKYPDMHQRKKINEAAKAKKQREIINDMSFAAAMFIPDELDDIFKGIESICGPHVLEGLHLFLRHFQHRRPGNKAERDKELSAFYIRLNKYIKSLK